MARTVLEPPLPPRAGAALGIPLMVVLGLSNGSPVHLPRVHLPKQLLSLVVLVGHRQALAAAQVATATEPCPEARVVQVGFMAMALRTEPFRTGPQEALVAQTAVLLVVARVNLAGTAIILQTAPRLPWLSQQLQPQSLSAMEDGRVLCRPAPPRTLQRTPLLQLIRMHRCHQRIHRFQRHPLILVYLMVVARAPRPRRPHSRLSTLQVRPITSLRRAPATTPVSVSADATARIPGRPQECHGTEPHHTDHR